VIPSAYAFADDTGGAGTGGTLTTYYPDFDSDLFGDPDFGEDFATQPEGFVLDNTDCDDSNVRINPGATEVSNGVDDDCDGIFTKGDILIIRDVPGKGLSHAKGTVKFFNNNKGFGF
jgi:hypothetical protein